MEYYLFSLLTLLAIFVMLGMSYNILLGFTGLFSIAHAGFFALGAYTAAILTKNLQWDFLAATIVGMVISMIASIGLGFASLRISGEFFVIGSLALQMVIVELVNNLQITGRSTGFFGIPKPTIFGVEFDTPLKVAILAWIGAIIVTLASRRIINSPLGRVLASIREDEDVSRSLGKQTIKTKVAIFALTSAMAALAGATYAGYTRYISPVEFGIARSVEILSLTIIGGLAAFWGPYVGAAITVFIPQALTFLQLPHSVAGAINAVLYSLLVILFLLFRPGGILGQSEHKRFVRLRVTGADKATAREERASPPLSAGRIAISQWVEADGGAANSALANGKSEVILNAENLSKSFGGLQAVRNLTFSLERNKITGLVGPNGAGKTTVFNLLTGFIPADDGRVLFKGEDITRWTPEERARLGLIRSFQDVRLFGGITVLENLLLALTPVEDEGVSGQFTRWRSIVHAEKERIDRARETLEYIGLGGREHYLARDLSYAEQKLLMIGRLVVTGADCLLLDEPMAGLDQSARVKMGRILHEIAETGKAICLIEHNMDVVRDLCSWIVFLDQGQAISTGTPKQIMEDKTLVDLYFGTA